MVRERLAGVVDALRLRIHRGLQLRTIAPGDRLPSTRQVAEDLRTDPRVVASAYRLLAAEGLLEVRARSGIYVSPDLAVTRSRPEPPPSWLAGLFAQGIARGISVPDLTDVLRTAVPRRVRTVVVATTVDQTEGICRELRDNFGLNARGVLAHVIDRGGVPHVIRRSQLVITTDKHERRLRAVAQRLNKRFVCMKVRDDLYETEWSLFREHDAYVIVADARFGRLVRDYLRSLGAADRVHILVAGRHDLSGIPETAPAYATQAARARLPASELPLGLLPPARVIADDCAREIMTEVIRAS